MSEKKSKKLLVGINVIFITNIIKLVFNAITNFILPKFLSIDSYAQIKEYQMYISYAGILFLGYGEGLYLSYGGKDYSSIDKDDLRKNVITLFLFQSVLILILSFFAIITSNKIILLALLSALPINMVGLYESIYQATGEFHRYGKIINISSILTLIVNMVLIFIIGTDNALVYITFYFIIYLFVWIILELPNKFYRKLIGGFSFNILIRNIRSGFLLMLSNFASIIQTTMDRLFVKYYLPASDFAYYSFAVSMENMINVLITPITVTMYNYFCKNKGSYKKLLNYILIAGSFVISSAFFVNIIIKYLLPDYTKSNNIIFILFAAQFFYVLIRGIYINLYKANSMQNTYFKKLVFVVLIGAILNFIIFNFLKMKEAFSIATLITAILWYILSTRDFPDIGMGVRENIYIFYEIVSFLLLGLSHNTILGFIFFLIITVIGITFILKLNLLKEVKFIFSIIKS